MIKFTEFVQKPVYGKAIQITEQNIIEVTEWIEIVVPDKNARPIPYTGDWLWYNENGVWVYTDTTFKKSFYEAKWMDWDIDANLPVGHPGIKDMTGVTPRAPEDMVE